MDFLCELTIGIPGLPCHFRISEAALWNIEVVNSATSDSLISLYLGCALLPATISPLSWSHVQMDGEERDDKQYIWCQGCQCPQFRSLNDIAPEAHV